MSVIFNKSVQDIEMKFDMTTRNKTIFWVFTSNTCL